jgi:hypothetical protein
VRPGTKVSISACWESRALAGAAIKRSLNPHFSDRHLSTRRSGSASLSPHTSQGRYNLRHSAAIIGVHFMNPTTRVHECLTQQGASVCLTWELASYLEILANQGAVCDSNSYHEHELSVNIR